MYYVSADMRTSAIFLRICMRYGYRFLRSWATDTYSLSWSVKNASRSRSHSLQVSVCDTDWSQQSIWMKFTVHSSSSSSSSWREAFSRSIPPLRFVAKTSDLPAAKRRSLIFPCPGRSDGSKWWEDGQRHESGDGRAPSWASQQVRRIWFAGTSSVSLATWPNSLSLRLRTMEEAVHCIYLIFGYLLTFIHWSAVTYLSGVST